MAMAAMAGMPDMAMPFARTLVFAMWWVMMLGMMLPSAAPMILTFATLNGGKRDATTLCADGDVRRGLPDRVGRLQSCAATRRNGGCSGGPAVADARDWPVRLLGGAAVHPGRRSTSSRR